VLVDRIAFKNSADFSVDRVVPALPRPTLAGFLDLQRRRAQKSRVVINGRLTNAELVDQQHAGVTCRRGGVPNIRQIANGKSSLTKQATVLVDPTALAFESRVWRIVSRGALFEPK
jgi:hypothetical protein